MAEYPPISDAVHHRLRAVFRAAGIDPTREQVERLTYLAQWSVDQVSWRAIPHRPRRKPRRRRPGDPPKERLIKRRGAPRNREMREFFGNLAAWWLDVTGDLPGVSFNWWGAGYEGRFVAFVQAFARELLEDLMNLPSSHSALAAALDDIINNPVRVRTWLRAARVNRLKKLNESWRESTDS